MNYRGRSQRRFDSTRIRFEGLSSTFYEAGKLSTLAQVSLNLSKTRAQAYHAFQDHYNLPFFLEHVDAVPISIGARSVLLLLLLLRPSLLSLRPRNSLRRLLCLRVGPLGERVLQTVDAISSKFTKVAIMQEDFKLFYEVGTFPRLHIMDCYSW